MRPSKPDVHGPDSLTERLTMWKNRATHDSYTDRAVRGAQITDGMANAIRSARNETSPSYPQIGDVATVACPHCDGPMYVVNVVHDEIVIQCPDCSKGTK